MTDDSEAFLKNIARDIQAIRSELTQVINYMHDAESEVPEKMRRFMMYMHDMHDIKYMYEELGLQVPKYILKECERCDDRLRQILEDLHADQGAFERVRQEMSGRKGNKWDWSRQLMKPENGDETG